MEGVMTTTSHNRYRFWNIAFAASAGLALAAAATATEAAPAAYLQSAAITGAGNVLTLNRVPVQDNTGKITYKNVLMTFAVDNTGKLTLNTASVSIIASPTLNVGAYKPGTYNGYNVGSDSTNHYFIAGAPGVGADGRISGSIQRITTNNYTSVFNASWTSGPVIGHPLEALLVQAGITSNGYNWGIMGTAGASTASSGWRPGDIIGVIQTGNQLSMWNFGQGKVPVSSLTFTLCPTANPC